MDMEEYRKQAYEILDTVNQVILGKEEVTGRILMAMLAGGHILLEDVPGVGKTSLAVAFSRAMGFQWRRVQFTPDVMPSDLTGFSIYQKEAERFVYQPGAVFCNLLLADELNRTSPRTQSALLEAMEEGQVTAEGETRPLPNPFHVIATQNPTGMLGTQPLLLAQADRFMVSLSLGYPAFEDEVRMAKGEKGEKNEVRSICCCEDFERMKKAVRNIYVHDEVCRYAVSLVVETRNHELLELGASPRAVSALIGMAKAMAWLSGEDYVTPDQVRILFTDAVKHRIVLNSKGRHQGIQKRELLEEILERVPEPLKRSG